jgi:hypothetical protein
MKTKLLGSAIILLAIAGCKPKSNVANEQSFAEKPTPGRLCSPEENQKINNDLAMSSPLYQQHCLAYTDKTGDINLAHLLATSPLGLATRVMGKKARQAQKQGELAAAANRWDPKFLNAAPFDINQIVSTSGKFVPNAGQKTQLSLPGYAEAAELNRGKVLVGRQNPIDVNRFLKMFAAIVNKTKIAPYIGEVHRFSVTPEELERYVIKDGSNLVGGALLGLSRDQMFHVINTKGLSKVFASLALGVTSRTLYTGGERALLEFLASREESSVQFHEFFEFAYRMHNGDVYLTILSMENTLSRWWRAQNRDNLMSTRKLANITNSYMGSDDRYGAWYHFLGIALLGVVEGKFATTVAAIESQGSHVLNQVDKLGEDEAQEDAINDQGAAFGEALGRTIRELSNQSNTEKIDTLAKKFSVSGPGEAERALLPENYLNLTEDFRDRLTMPLSPVLKAVGSSDKLTISTTQSGLSRCHVEIFPINKETTKRDSTLLRHFTANLSPAQPLVYTSATAWPAGNVALNGARVIISGCQGQSEKVFVADAAP